MRRLALTATLCLAFVNDAAIALGLGGIEVFSSLNQPLRAEITLLAVRPDEREAIVAQLASDEAFARAGIQRGSIPGDLSFRVTSGALADQAIIQVSSAQPVREPFLTLLVEVSWPNGRVVREYTLLLDPPVIQSGRGARQPVSDFTSPSSTGLDLGSSAEPSRSVSGGGGNYGPVREQETLWSIAYANRPDDSVPMDRMMQAIYEANPEAFDGSMTRIRAGSMLRIPDVSGAGTPRPAARRAAPPAAEPAISKPPAPAAGPSQAAAPPPVTEQPKGELRLSPPPGDQSSAPTSTESGKSTDPSASAPAVAPVPSTEAVPEAAPGVSPAPIEVRDNAAKALEMLATHAREHAARQAASDQLAASTAQNTTQNTTQAASTPADKAVAPPAATATPPAAATPAAPATAPVAEPAAPVPAQTQGQTQAPATPTAPADAAADSPFVDEPVVDEPTVDAPAGQTSGAAQPPATVDTAASDAQTPAAVDSVESAPAAQTETSGAFNPLLLGLVAAAILLLALGASRLRKYRAARSAIQIAPVALAEVEAGEPTFLDEMEPLQPVVRAGDTLRTRAEPALARTTETTLHSTLPPEQSTQKFMAVSTLQPAAVIPEKLEPSAPGTDPYADVLGEVDIHIAYGLYDEAARLMQEPLAKSPNRKDLHLKLLEVFFSANMPAEFESQARKMQSVAGGSADPDWEKACIMGRQLCPDSALFGSSGSGTGNLAVTTPDLDFSSMLGGAPAAADTAMPASTSASPAPPPATRAGDALDLDLSAFNLELNSTPATTAPAAAPPQGPADSGNTLDFNLEDFKLDASPTAVAGTAEAADSSLNVDLADFDLGSPEPAAAPAASVTATADEGLDDLLMPQPAGEGQADTRLDLARAYMDMGEPDMAKSLLQEVMAQGGAAQKQEARELLGKLASL